MFEIRELKSAPDEEMKQKIAELYYEVFNQTYPSIQKSMDKCLDTVNYWLRNYEKVFLVVSQCDEGLAGFMILGNSFLDELYIRRDFQKKGIGKQLVDIAKSNYSKLSLYTLKFNENAISFYIKNGFVIKKYGIAPDEKVEDVYMEWECRNE